jgi:hypothetical protein
MGIRAMLLVVDPYPVRDGELMAHTQLDLHHCSDDALYDALGEVPDAGLEIAEFFSYRASVSCGDKCTADIGWGPIHASDCGTGYHLVKVESLLPLAGHAGVLEFDRNQAAWAYLGALRPGTLVAVHFDW